MKEGTRQTAHGILDLEIAYDLVGRNEVKTQMYGVCGKLVNSFISFYVNSMVCVCVRIKAKRVTGLRLSEEEED